MTEKTLNELLEIRFDSDAGDNLSVREYLKALLVTLWNEREGFSGKRPFGNSDWEYELYKPLIVAGAILGDLDEDGYINSCDNRAGKELVHRLISAAMEPHPSALDPEWLGNCIYDNLFKSQPAIIRVAIIDVIRRALASKAAGIQE